MSKKTPGKKTSPKKTTDNKEKSKKPEPPKKQEKQEKDVSDDNTDLEDDEEYDIHEETPPKKEHPRQIKDQDHDADIGEEGDDADAVEDEQDEFAEQILDTYKSPYEYFIFDPKRYKYDSHKEINIVSPENRITSEIMTIYEYTEVVSHRAKQIENGGVVFVDIKNETDPIKIAELEIKNKKCPLSILRMYNSNYGEIWAVNELGWNML